MDYSPLKGVKAHGELAESSNKTQNPLLQGLTQLSDLFFSLLQFASEHICNFELVHPFTGEQAGKYGGVNGALGNGYKGENEHDDAGRSS